MDITQCSTPHWTHTHTLFSVLYAPHLLVHRRSSKYCLLSICLPICLVCPQDFEDVSSSQLKKLKKIFQREQFKEAERKKKEVCHV